MTTKNDLGTMGSNPLTGECFAACIDTPPPAEFDELIRQGALLERRPLSVIRDAFCEVAPSRQILHVGPSIGKYQGCEIPDWHETADGTRYRYVAVCGAQPDLRTLTVDQVVVAPGLIYERAP